MSVASPLRQVATIPDWHPAQRLNSQTKRHWSAIQKQHDAEAQRAYWAAKAAGWTRLEGRVRLEIVFVYPRRYRVDADNLYARVKGILDGIKTHFFKDDSTEWLDLRVRARFGAPKAVEMTLEAA